MPGQDDHQDTIEVLGNLSGASFLAEFPNSVVCLDPIIVPRSTILIAGVFIGSPL